MEKEQAPQGLTCMWGDIPDRVHWFNKYRWARSGIYIFTGKRYWKAAKSDKRYIGTVHRCQEEFERTVWTEPCVTGGSHKYTDGYYRTVWIEGGGVSYGLRKFNQKEIKDNPTDHRENQGDVEALLNAIT